MCVCTETFPLVIRDKVVVAVLYSVSCDPVASDVHHEDPDRAVHVGVILLEVLVICWHSFLAEKGNVIGFVVYRNKKNLLSVYEHNEGVSFYNTNKSGEQGLKTSSCKCTRKKSEFRVRLEHAYVEV